MIIKKLIITLIVLYVFKESFIGIIVPTVKVTIDDLLTNLTSLFGPVNVIWR
ncbi:hypothetical protein RI065_07610 [Mycoplasmatota bacterium zrk1]